MNIWWTLNFTKVSKEYYRTTGRKRIEIRRYGGEMIYNQSAPKDGNGWGMC